MKVEKIKTPEIIKWRPVPGKPGCVEPYDSMTYREVYNTLKTHLEAHNMIPDDYFQLAWRVDGNEKIRFDGDIEFRAYSNWGGNEGIYIDVCVSYGDETRDFIAGKSLREDSKGYIWMKRICAEIELFLNAEGCDISIPYEEEEK